MKERRILLFMVAAVLLSSCVANRSGVKSIVGIWELSRADHIRAEDTGFIQNIKLVIKADGSVYKLGPSETRLADTKLYKYEILNGELIMTRKYGGRVLKNHYELQGERMILRSDDGVKLTYRRIAGSEDAVPALEAVAVPCSVRE